MKKKYFYLIKLQFLGFRFSGWQKQTNAKTIQAMVDKTFSFIFKHQNFKTLGAGRTDAKVSANEFCFELFVFDKCDTDQLLKDLNHSFPADIRALSVCEVDQKFNIINDPKIKEYNYFFTFGEKNHPFCAPFMVCFDADLNLELMQVGARLFKGEHDFQRYCYKPSADAKFVRVIDDCEIVENDIYTANFFPKHSCLLKVQSKGFMRHQIRLMMGALISLGMGEITLNDIKVSLIGGNNEALGPIVPSSGLLLQRIDYH